MAAKVAVLRSQEPWNMWSPQTLGKWYKENVEDGCEGFAAGCNESMDQLVRFLQDFKGIKIKEVQKAGSLEKGTFIKDGSDLDTVVISNKIKPLSEVTDTGRYRQQILRPRVEKLVAALQAAPFVKGCNKGDNNMQLKVTVKQSKQGEAEIDVLLTADNLSYEYHDTEDMKKRLVAPYNAMMKMNNKTQRFIYQPCLTPLQTNFVKSQPGNVKSLIRFVKYWKAEYLQKRQTEKLINSYTLELITIYVYEEEMDSPDTFDLADSFKRVLTLLASRLDGFQHFWDVFYSKDVARRNVTRLKRGSSQYFTNIPILLDPADPTDNVFERWMDGLHKVSKLARETLDTPFMQNTVI